ncbi:hypothetical protein CN326_02545 [Bacillus sp. AFS018417]|uniref:hypothetical protein n=1 Tax=Bacillus sp. AFS018417 TaxID=2033491 RepID=UPI000BF51788|nr:hypothetical protein [Bacillus sp. AFS018417]PEZ09235.1 hypothetical protein CN326_02545 [Bacillus sp. AFS018417]
MEKNHDKSKPISLNKEQNRMVEIEESKTSFSDVGGKEDRKKESKSRRYNKWYIYLLITLSLTLVFRAGKLYNLYHKTDGNTTPNISEEERKAIAEFDEKEAEKWKKKLDESWMSITLLQFQTFKVSDVSENSLRRIVADHYVPIVLEKAGQPSMEKLKNSHPVKAYKEGENTYLSVRSDDNSTFILEMSGHTVNHIYGENWDSSEQEMQRYHELLNKLETQGEEAKVK